jgi:predicted dinucleotide-utilizing enzyme
MPAPLDKLTTQVGFIGLGLMGSRLARRLDSSGWRVRAWNRTPKPAEELNKWEIAIAPTIANLVADSDVILSSLANDEAVRSVYLDEGGVFSTARPGTTILEMSTISPELSRRLHQEARAKRRQASSMLPSQGRRQRWMPERSHYLRAVTKIPSSNVSLSSSRLPGSGS